MLHAVYLPSWKFSKEVVPQWLAGETALYSLKDLHAQQESQDEIQFNL